MSKIVAVVNPTNGLLFTPNSSNTHLTVRLESDMIDSTNGYMNVRKVSTFVRLPIEMKTVFCKMAGLPTTDAPFGTPDESGKYPAKEFNFGIEGTIQVQEAHEPFYGPSERNPEGHLPKINPQTNEVILTNGKPVYRQTAFITQKGIPSRVFGTVSVVTRDDGNVKYVFAMNDETAESQAGSGIQSEDDSVTQHTTTPAAAFTTANVPS